MGLFLEAARVWDELCKISYSIILGYKGRLSEINLTFEPDDLPHLVGMQYAKDVDFGLRPAEYYGANLVNAVLSGRLNESRICNARAWPRIEGRLKAIINLRHTLSGDFEIARFNPKKVHGSCNINAEYIIRNRLYGQIFFVFLDSQNGRYYCKSAFQNGYIDYMRFQTRMTVLSVTKQDSSGTELLYRREGFETVGARQSG